MRSAIVALVVLFGLVGPPGGPAAAQIRDRARLISTLDSAAAAHAADSTVAGVAVAVVRGADTLLLAGYGRADLELDVPTPPDAVYEIGSITKQFTAAAILLLAEEGRVGLDAEITEYLPDYDTRGHAVTVRHLLQHTSGIRSYTEMAAFGPLSREALPRDTLLALVQAEPFDFAPGTAMIYSNTGFFLLGLIVEEASGRSYESFVEERLFGPAGMVRSRYCDERAVVERRAHGYDWGGELVLLRKAYLDHTWPYAAGSLCSTAGDLVAWNRALHGGRILPKASYRELTTPGRLRDGTELRYAMGLAVHEAEGRRVIAHGGGINGFLSQSRYYPDDDLIVVALQNSMAPTGPDELADALARLVLGPWREPATSPYRGDLAPFEGSYAGRARGRFLEVEVSVRDEGLAVRRSGADEDADPLEHLSGLTWREGADRYTFTRAGDRIVELRYDTVGGHYVLRRVGER